MLECYKQKKNINIELPSKSNRHARRCQQIRPRGYKTFFMLNSIEHEILNAYKYKNISRNSAFLGSDKPRMLFFPLINVKMLTIVGILTFMSRKNFMLS